ncbi:MAG: peptide deformylase [Geminicoccales bacterium]
MAVLEILEAPDPRLTTACRPVERIDAPLLRLLDDMLETMYAAPGIGLAAPQVGVLTRAFVADVGEEGNRSPLFLINPELVWRSDTSNLAEEGCLSLPKQFGEVARADQVRVRYMDREGQDQELAAEGLLARCLQHEIDHLNGVLFVDHLSMLKRGMILRRLAKSKRTRSKASA